MSDAISGLLVGCMIGLSLMTGYVLRVHLIPWAVAWVAWLRSKL